MPTGLYCLLVGTIDYRQDAIVMCGRHGLAGSIIEVQSYYEGNGGRSVTRVHESVTQVQNKVQLRAMKNEWARKCNGDMHGLTVY